MRLNKKGQTGEGILGLFILTTVIASLAGSPFVCDSNGGSSDEGLFGKECLVGEGGKYAVQVKKTFGDGSQVPVRYAYEVNGVSTLDSDDPQRQRLTSQPMGVIRP